MADRTRTRPARWLDRVTIALFALAVVAPTIDLRVRADVARGPARELREAAPMPSFPGDLSRLSSFPALFEHHFADTFGLRDVLLRWNSLDKYFVFGVAPTPTLQVGAGGWIFFRGDRTLEVFRGVAPLDERALEAWRRRLVRRRDELRSIGCGYLFVIVPNKETVYPERIPAPLTRVGPTRLDQFVAWMRARSDVDILDLRASAFDAKTRDEPENWLYSPLGTHWGGRGALVAYRALVEHLALTLGGCRALADDEIEWGEVDEPSDTWAQQMYIQDVLRQREHYARRRGGVRFEIESHDPRPPVRRWTSTPDEWRPRAVLFHDSFGPFFWNVLPESFSRLLMVNRDYEPYIVQEERPDVVIEMWVERALVSVQPDATDPPLEDAVASFEKLPLALFQGSLGSLRAFGGGAIEPISIEGRDTLRFGTTATIAGVETPSLSMPSGRAVRVRIDIESDARTTLDLAWRSEADGFYRRSDRVPLWIERGRTTRVIRLSPPPGPGRLVLRARAQGLRLTLRDFEVRAERGP